MGADFVGADLKGALAQAANFRGALFIRANMTETDCLGAIFSGINGMAAQFQEANLECADLSQANLSNVDFRGINGAWANFSQTRLNWSNFTLAQLEASDFEGANLTGATLRASNMSFANLQGSNLQSSDAYFSNFSGALIPQNPQTAMNVSSVRITYQTYVRSGWRKENLREWQARGATILDFEAFPQEVQGYIRAGRCNLRITFSTSVQNDEQRALEALIFAFFGRQPSFRILSVRHDGRESTVAFLAPSDEAIERFAMSLRDHSWSEQSESIRSMYEECCKIHSEAGKFEATSSKRDVIEVLGRLSGSVAHIQALLSVSRDDHIRRLSEKLAEGDTVAEEKSQVRWSSVFKPIA